MKRQNLIWVVLFVVGGLWLIVAERRAART